MRNLKLIIIPLLLLLLALGTISTNAYAQEDSTLDQETIDRIRDSYGLDMPDPKDYQDPLALLRGDFGMTSSAAVVLHLLSIPIQPISFMLRNLVNIGQAF